MITHGTGPGLSCLETSLDPQERRERSRRPSERSRLAVVLFMGSLDDMTAACVKILEAGRWTHIPGNGKRQGPIPNMIGCSGSSRTAGRNR